jgi:electron transfer flavoprotein-quinone oxidoreductase
MIEDRFGIGPDEGEAHLFSGNLFEGVRGGGFLYTNEDSLSIGTVFHLDSIAAEEAEPHQLLDNLLTHPFMEQWLDGDSYHEREYSAKLVPDSKKVAHESPHKDRLVLVGDAAGQMQAQGPIIKGMNHAVTAGALAADAFVETRETRETAGKRYAQKLRESGTMEKLRPDLYEKTSSITESQSVTNLIENLADSSIGRFGLKLADRAGLVEAGFSSPLAMKLMPDTRAPYATLPTIIAQELGTPVEADSSLTPPGLDDRIGDLTYDTDIGNPHIEVLDNSWDASGTAVTACPVSAKDFGGGCYREETVKTNGTEERVVSLDTQPCVECGTCAVIADTHWEHPRGGKGVEYREG